MTEQTHLAPLDPNQRYSVKEALAYLRVSRNLFYADIAAGRLKIIKSGKRTFVPGTEIIRLSRID